jgi:hypothetical protein
MKYKDKLKTKYTEQQDGRRKILTSQYQEVWDKYAFLKSMRKVAAIYGVDKRLIQFIVYPERLARLKAHNIKIKHHLKYYKGGKEWAEAMRKHRQRKALIIK